IFRRSRASSERPIVPVAVLDRGAAQAFALAPFLLPLRVLALQRFAPVDLRLVAGLPLAPAAGGQEHADQQSQEEDKDADRPKVRVGGDVHCASPTSKG